MKKYKDTIAEVAIAFIILALIYSAIVFLYSGHHASSTTIRKCYQNMKFIYASVEEFEKKYEVTLNASLDVLNNKGHIKSMPRCITVKPTSFSFEIIENKYLLINKNAVNSDFDIECSEHGRLSIVHKKI